jgi:GxxExxY protein
MEANQINSELIFAEESYAIIGACFNVYNDKGCGCLEGVFQECLEIEFEFQQIPFVAQKEFQLSHRGRRMRQTFKSDFVCYDEIILEIKAVSRMVDEHRAQWLNYLNATGCQLGMLVNFGHFPRLEYERIAFTERSKRPRLTRLGRGDQWERVAWK